MVVLTGFHCIFVTKNQILFTSKISSIRVFFIKEPQHILFLIKELQPYPRLLGTEFDFVKASGSLRQYRGFKNTKNTEYFKNKPEAEGKKRT